MLVVTKNRTKCRGKAAVHSAVPFKLLAVSEFFGELLWPIFERAFGRKGGFYFSNHTPRLCRHMRNCMPSPPLGVRYQPLPYHPASTVLTHHMLQNQECSRRPHRQGARAESSIQSLPYIRHAHHPPTPRPPPAYSPSLIDDPYL